MMRRLPGHLSIGFGVLLLRPLGKQTVTVLPFVRLDWQITDRLALRSRQDITFTYFLDPRQRLSVAAVGSFFGRRLFRLDQSGVFQMASPRSMALRLAPVLIGSRSLHSWWKRRSNRICVWRIAPDERKSTSTSNTGFG